MGRGRRSREVVMNNQVSIDVGPQTRSPVPFGMGAILLLSGKGRRSCKYGQNCVGQSP